MFMTTLVVTPVFDHREWWEFWKHRRQWKLVEPLAYRTDVAGGRTIEVPAGYVTDFSSVPRIPIVFTLTGDCAHRAAVVHDYLYGQQGAIGDGYLPLTRAQCDDVFHEAMAADGVDDFEDEEPEWRRALMWAGVRAGGWAAWRAKA